MPVSLSAPLAQVRAYVRAHRGQGVRCPACDQNVKVYRRRINSGMARSLITMFLAGATEYVHVPTVVGRGSSEEGKLAYWGLVEERRTKNTGGGRDGYWRVTDVGRRFVSGQLLVPQFAIVYDGACLRLEGDLVGIREVLGSGGFDYDELMAGCPEG